MNFEHKPVLLDECIKHLNIKPDGVYLDGTVGGAGHAVEIYRRLSKNGLLIGFDQDEFALETSRKRLAECDGKAGFLLFYSNFVNMKDICIKNGISGVDGILLDLGVSSHQLDEAARGFSYQYDAPLDMRMDRRNGLTAEIVVNEYSEEQLKDVIRNYGEEKWAARIASFIVNARKKERIKTTGQLVEIIKAAIPSAARREGPHPAKRTFQAIRIEVNNELGILKKTVDDAVAILKPGGRLCIITFHSLEDRIIKNEFHAKVRPCTCPANFPVCVCGKVPVAVQITKKPVIPSDREVAENPRARSAKLRVIQKI